MTALRREWKKKKPLLEGKSITSVYFGGGTPSLLGAERIGEILSWIEPGDIEITLEANPEAFDPKPFAAAGINRISLGVQSFDDTLLKTLSRTHSAIQATQAIMATKEAGIDNITIDLMYELPGQTLEQWESTVQQALSLPITHLSLYNLTFEPHTVFYKKRETLLQLVPDDEMGLQMLEKAVFCFESAGLKRYEISAFALEGYRSHHNLGYWTGRPFLGFGPSSFSYWEGSRFQNVCNLNRYASQEDPTHFSETLPKERQRRELLAIGLRMVEGVPFQKKFPQSPLKRLEREGFLTIDTHITLTPKGQRFYDHVAAELV